MKSLKLRQILTVMMAVLMVVVTMPSYVFAEPNQDPDPSQDPPQQNPPAAEFATIEVSGDITSVTPADGTANSVTVTYTNGTLVISGMNLEATGEPNGNGNYEIVSPVGQVNIAANGNDNYIAFLFIGGNQQDGPGGDYNLAANDLLQVTAEFQTSDPNPGQNPGQDPGQNPDPGQDPGQGQGQGQGQNPQQPQPGGPEDIDFDILVVDTHINASINDVVICDDYNGEFHSDFKGIVQGAGYTDSAETNTLKLVAPFGDYPFTSFTINGVLYEKNSAGVVIENDMWIITVPGASKYTIRGEADKSAALVRTIIWANVGADESNPDFAQDMQLKHGTGRIVGIYDAGGNKIGGTVDVDASGMGWVPVEPGSKVVFEFVPEYGYQLTRVLANGFPLEPQETINQYTFTMPDTNIHFAAEFTPTEDVVSADSSKVEGGTIELDGSDLLGGSARLNVSDAELSSDKIEGFENAAGEYTISDYLDIDLYNIFYKGKNDSDDVWADKIDELDSEATITIQLKDGVTADDIVIVHNIHNGETYEVIEIDSYDSETNTITFRTKSFSSYAIATKENATEPEKTTPEKKTPDKETTKKTTAEKTGEKTTTSKVTKSTTKKTNPPATGDGEDMISWLALTFVVGIATLVGAVSKKASVDSE